VKVSRIEHLFVEFLPDDIEEGVLYVSMPYAIVEHRCCCGCGEKVVTPLSPTDWSLTFDGKTVSLRPSIGNWNFPCQSHYWIRGSEVIWAPRWTREQIEAGRWRDRRRKATYYAGEGDTEIDVPPGTTLTKQSPWSRLLWRLKGWFR
jgi:hypothetical protein